MGTEKTCKNTPSGTHTHARTGWGNSHMLLSCVLLGAVQATLLQGRAIGLGEEGVDAHPQERDDGGQEDRPDDDDGRGSVLPSEQTLEERVEMDNHPEREEELPEERPPGFVSVVDRVGDAGHHTDEVEEEQGGRRNQQGCPFERVQLRELLVVSSLCCHREARVHTSYDLEKSLEHSKEMGRDTTNNPKLLISPPIVNRYTSPSHLQNARSKNADEKRHVPDAGKIAKLWSDELPRQQADGRQCTVGQKWNGGPRIDDGVNV